MNDERPLSPLLAPLGASPGAIESRDARPRPSPPARSAGSAVLALELKDEASRHHVRLDQAHLHRIPEDIGSARLAADQAMAGFLVDVIVGGQRANWDEAIRAGLVQGHEEPEPGDARDPSREAGPHFRGEEGGDEAILGLALGGIGPPLGHGDVLSDTREGGFGSRREAAGPEIEGADQGAVDEEIGVAPDGRGEMGVAAERQAEMAEIVRAVDRLRLAPEDDLADQPAIRRAGNLVEDLREVSRAQHLPLGEL